MQRVLAVTVPAAVLRRDVFVMCPPTQGATHMATTVDDRAGQPAHGPVWRFGLPTQVDEDVLEGILGQMVTAQEAVGDLQ